MFSDIEKKRRIDAAIKLMEQEDLKGIYLIGNGTVGTNAFGCFRYYVNTRVFFHLSSAVLTPDGKLVGVAANQMGRLGMIGRSFLDDCVVNVDQLGGVIDYIKACGITKGRLGVLMEVLPSSWLHRMKAELPEVEFVDVADQILAIRMVKSEEEIEMQRICGKIADVGYQAMCENAKPGMYENELVAICDRAMQRLGMEDSFALIASGRFSAKENGLTTLHNYSSINRQLQVGDSVAMEITPRYAGYWTQIVRTISIGEPNPDLDEFRRVTVGAIKAATDIMKAGIPVGDLVKAMRAYTESAGYKFNMPAGHIAGVDLNEERIFEENTRPLLPGMLVILHPTVVNDVLPSGIFWGESYLVTETGFEPVMSSGSELFVTGK